MRTGIILVGALVLAIGIIIEVVGVLYANSFVEHNIYGIGGGVLGVGGIIAISVGRSSLVRQPAA